VDRSLPRGIKVARLICLQLLNANMVPVSAHLRLALAWIGVLNTRNVDQMTALISDKFVSTIRPRSLGIPPVGKKEYVDRFVSTPITNFNIALPTDADIIENTNVVEFYTTADGSTKHGFPWKQEYIFTFTYDNDKILSVTEFVDASIVTSVIFNETVAAQAQLSC